MIRPATFIAAIAVLVAGTQPAEARVTRSFLAHHSTSVHLRSYRILGDGVRVVSWRPGNGYVRALVHYSTRRRTVPIWAHARRADSRAVAAVNGGTWHWTTARPVGTVWTRGRRISSVQPNPAVGFLSRGRVVFGARSARRAGSGNIVAGEAYLIRHGRIATRYRYAHSTQISCSTCFRSNVVRFKGGRVGLVEIGRASMTEAAHVLKRLHVKAALTLDSGGSAILWQSVGHGGCAGARVRGSCMGIAHAEGLPWERQVPDAITIMVRRRA